MIDTGMGKSRAVFRFYEELNDFLPPCLRKRPFDVVFEGRPSVKDVIEARGIPHAEVDLILINGRSVDFGHPLNDGDRVSVYPVYESLDISPVIRLRPEPLREPKFILDVHLGKLARLLRLAGLDAAYRNDYQNKEIVETARREHRCILTRDRHLLKRKTVTRGVWIRSSDPRMQLKETIRRFDLTGRIDPFSRCLKCNVELEPVDKEHIRDRLPPRTKRYYRSFKECPQCGRIYWKGSHYRHMKKCLNAWTAEISGPADSDRG